MSQPPAMEIDEQTVYQVTIETDRGPIVGSHAYRALPFESLNPRYGRPSALLPIEATTSPFELRTRRVPAEMVRVLSRTVLCAPLTTAFVNSES